MPGPLEGFNVLDITQGLAGPYCSMEAADAGASVVKVEPPEGDYARGWAPFVEHESAIFLAVNRGKKSVVLDLEKDRDALAGLVRKADVFLSDLSPSDGARLGLDYGATSAWQPDIVHCSLTPWGKEGPLADLPGAELPVQAMADYPNSLGRIGTPPLRLGADVASINGGQAAFQGILAALFSRARTGQGQEVSVSMLGALMQMRGILWMAQSDTVNEWYGFHQDSYTRPPDHGYRCKDGFVFMTLGRRQEDAGEGPATIWEEMGVDEPRDDARFHNFREATGATGRYYAETKAKFEEGTSKLTVAEVQALARKWGGLAVPLMNYDDLAGHPQVAAVEMIQELDHPTLGRIKVAGIPWKFSASPARLTTAAPSLGQHTSEVLATLG